MGTRKEHDSEAIDTMRHIFVTFGQHLRDGNPLQAGRFALHCTP